MFSRLLIGVVVLGVLGVGAAVWLQRALPRIAAAQIGRLVNAHVEMGAVDLCLDGSVAVAGLVIRPKPRERLADDAILRAEHVSARFSRRSLISLSPRVAEIRVEGFLLDACLDLDTGRWNLGTLRFNAPGGGGGGIPAIHLQRGKLRYRKLSGVQQEVVMSIPVAARFGREGEGDPSYSFEIKTSKLSGGYGDSRLTGRWRPCLLPEGPGKKRGHSTFSSADGSPGPAQGEKVECPLFLPGELTLTGGLSSTDIPSLERAWAIDVLAGELRYDRSGNYSLKLSLKDLHGKHAPEMDTLRWIAPDAEGAGALRSLQAFFAEYQPTGTVGSIAIQANGNARKWHESAIKGKVVCKDISICDSKFPYRIDHLRGELDFTQSTLRVNGLVGRHGAVEVRIDGWTRGFGRDRQYQYQITSPNMVLDPALYAALNPQQKRFWDAFRPTGTVAVDYRLTRTSPTDKRLSLVVDLNDVTAAYQEFPYPLAGLTGRLFFDHKSIVLSEVVSRAGGRHIQVNGKVTEPSSSKPVYYLSIDAKDIPLDATLRDALPLRHRELFRRFDVNGLADIRGRVFSMGETGEVAASAPAGPNEGGPEVSRRIRFLADVSCREGSLKLPSPAQDETPGARPPGRATRDEVRPLVVSKIRAEATLTPDSLSIRKLEGRHGRSPVAVTGSVRFDEDDKLKHCHMKITARQVPLAEATAGLLPPALMEPAAAFDPEGDVNLVVELKKTDGDEAPQYSVTMECLDNRIRHQRFAYPLQDIRGTVLFTKDNLVLRNITARPRDEEQSAVGGAVLHPPSSVIRVDGSAQVAGGRLENGAFTLRATDLLFTEALGRALPQTLAGLYREASPEGRFDLDVTTLKVSRGISPDAGPGAAEGEIVVEFGGKAHLGRRAGKGDVAVGGAAAPCSLKVSGAPMELSGVLEAEGSYRTKCGFERGQARLAVEQLVVRGKAITDTNVDAIYDPNTQTWTAANFVGHCYGGRLLGSLEIGAPRVARPSARPSDERREPSDAGLEYLLQVAFHDVDLQRFLQAGQPPDKGLAAEPARPTSSALRPSSWGLPAGSSGSMDAWLSLHARTGDRRPEGTPGEGAPRRSPAAQRCGVLLVEIANMQVGKVSPLGTILSVLRLSEPTDYLFERMLIDSYIRGDKLLIPKLELSGRNTTFAGSGTMDLSSDQINLTLTARSRPAAGSGAPHAAPRVWEPPSVLQSLTEGLTGAVVRMEVTGTVGSPRVQTKTLPVLEDSLRLLGTPEESRKGKK